MSLRRSLAILAMGLWAAVPMGCGDSGSDVAVGPGPSSSAGAPGGGGGGGGGGGRGSGQKAPPADRSGMDAMAKNDGPGGGGRGGRGGGRGGRGGGRGGGGRGGRGGGGGGGGGMQGMMQGMQKDMQKQMGVGGDEGSSGGGGGGGGPGGPGGGPGGPGGGGGFGGPGGPGGGGGFGGPGGGGGGRAVTKTLKELADQRFREGWDSEALDFLYAAILTNENEMADEILAKYKWSTGLKRPVLAIRVGLGMELNDPEFSGNPYPIGTKQDLKKKKKGNGGFPGGGGGGGFPGGGGGGFGGPGGPGGGGGGFGGPGGPGGGGGGGGGGGAADIEKFTGDIGKRMVTELTSRVRKGNFGNALRDAVARTKKKSSGRRGGGGGGRGGPGGGFGGPGGPGGGGGGFGGPGGPGGGGGGFGGPGGPGGGGGGFGGGGSQSQQNTGSVSPGIAYLGRGSESELMTSAAEQAVDVLVVFDVNVKETKSGIVKNLTKVSVHDVATGKKLGTTRRALDNVEIQNKGKKKLDDAIKQLLSTIDMKYKLTSKLAALPPGIKPEHIKSRMKKLLNGDTEGSRLWVLAEARLYHSKQLIEDSELQGTYDFVLGAGAGEQLASEEPAERKQALEEQLPEGHEEVAYAGAEPAAPAAANGNNAGGPGGGRGGGPGGPGGGRGGGPGGPGGGFGGPGGPGGAPGAPGAPGGGDATQPQGGQKKGGQSRAGNSQTTVGLQVGNAAPDIIGKDLDGVGFKLSDYRGKVVVLDFWGDW